MAGERKIVCAIDFGTTFSGFSFSMSDNPDQVYIPSDWGQIAGVPGATKTPTCLLTTPDGVKVGYDAVKGYAEMDPDEMTTARFFDRFKMKLYEADAGKLTKDTEVFDQEGKPKLALDVFADVLREMKSSFVQKANDQFRGELDENLVHWVVTVPAIWTDGAKQFMREAAVKANLVDRVDSDRLTIALEPEAASIQCQRLPVESLKSAAGTAQMPVGTQFLVLDAGGGTLDITIHKVLPDKELEEVYFVSGTSAGGAQIDENFASLLDDIFKKPFMKTFKQKNPAGFVDFMHKFEPVKKSFGPTSKNLQVTIPAGLSEMYEDEFGSQLRHSIKDKYTENKVMIAGGILRIPFDVVMTAFSPTVEKIVDYVKDLLSREELCDVKTILMVGGLSCSKVLQARIKEEFEKNYSIIIPDDASSVVVKGASIFGHQGKAIRSRICRKTYGVEITEKYDRQKHAGARMGKIDGIDRAMNVFSMFIERGKKVQPDTCITKKYFPVTENQKAIIFKFFATSSISAKFTSEEGMEQIGQLEIEIPGSGLDRSVELSMKFGGTNIEVEGKDQRNGNFVQASLDFLSK